MATERFRMRVAVFLILEKDGAVWLQRRANTGYRDGHYDLPAGHVDGGESAHSAMLREAKEETGVDIAPADLSGVHVLHNNDGIEYIDIFFRATKWEGEPKNMEPQKSDDAGWFALDALPSPITPHVESALKHIQNNGVYSEWGWNS